jgi:hypothetical protein
LNFSPRAGANQADAHGRHLRNIACHNTAGERPNAGQRNRQHQSFTTLTPFQKAT